MNYLEVFAASALGLAVFLVTIGLAALRRRDFSIVDIGWGVGFVVVAWVAYAVGEGPQSRRLLLAGMVTLWGGRLAVHLLLRRPDRAEGDAARSPGTDFALAGVLIWVVSLPVQVGAVADLPTSLGPVEVVGLVLYAVGIWMEVDARAGNVLDLARRRAARFPIRFGDVCVWWGIWIVASATGVGIYTIVSPALMTHLLLRSPAPDGPKLRSPRS